MEISKKTCDSVKATFVHFRNGKICDVEMRFTHYEDGEICITVRLYVEPNMTRKDYGGKLLNLLFKLTKFAKKNLKTGTHFSSLRRTVDNLRVVGSHNLSTKRI